MHSAAEPLRCGTQPAPVRVLSRHRAGTTAAPRIAVMLESRIPEPGGVRGSAPGPATRTPNWNISYAKLMALRPLAFAASIAASAATSRSVSS
ncbi:hypothetical protein GCM10009854_08140 [Saccharopolyspora halophila]|uniref:Uncharacterized protein n=1 Tax=Saccharopolyspora halophila TaxID=405551 RepID=A0ABP5SMH4_9PSEU